MANETYITIPTEVGLMKIQQAIWSGTKVNITKLGYGDGGGSYYVPTPDMIELKNLVGVTETQSTIIDTEEGVTWVTATIGAHLPNCVIRELGLYDDENDLCFISNCPDIHKVEVAKGTMIDIPLEIGIKHEYSQFITIPFDPSTLATKEWVYDHFMTVDVDNVTNIGKNVIRQIAYGPVDYYVYMEDVEFELPFNPEEEIIYDAYWEELRRRGEL